MPCGTSTRGFIRTTPEALWDAITSGEQTRRYFHGTRIESEWRVGGALVRPGDVMVGDNDGVLVVPSWMAVAVLEWALEHEDAENYIKQKIRSEGVCPGR